MEDYSPFGPFAPWNDWAEDIDEIIIKNGVTNIGEYAFVSHSSLKYIEIPKSVTVIGISAFESCDTLYEVYYGGTEFDRANISVESGNKKLTEVTWNYSELA